MRLSHGFLTFSRFFGIYFNLVFAREGRAKIIDNERKIRYNVKKKRINAVAFWLTKSRGCIFNVPHKDGFFRVFWDFTQGSTV